MVNKKTISQLIYIASQGSTTWYAAQQGIFFDGMDDVCAKLKAAGHQLQQRSDDWVLVDSAAWVSPHGVVRPHKTSNL